MNVLKTVTMAVALTGMAALAIAVAPSVYGQSRGRELTILSGRGGELGVRIADASAGGVEIEEVQPDSAAEKAGLKRGDVIVEFDGERVRSGRQFARLVQETPAGRAVKATVMRGGQRQDVQVTLAEGRGPSAMILGGSPMTDRLFSEQLQRFDRDLPREFPFNYNNFSFDIPGMLSGGGRLGVSVDELTNQLAEYFGTKDGVLVTSVTEGSAASRAGVKAGDVITSINGERVTSRSDLVSALRRVETEDVTIGIVRDKKETSLKAKIEAPRRTPRGARPV